MIMEDSKTLYCPSKFPWVCEFLQIHRQFGHISSKTVTSPDIEFRGIDNSSISETYTATKSN
jgi:hypothetical protein